MSAPIEIIRENITPSEVMLFVRQERAAGRLVSVNRLDAHLVEITITHPDKAIDVTPTRSREAVLVDLFKEHLTSGQVGISFRELKSWIAKHSDDKTALYELQDVADRLLAESAADGLLIENPEYEKGNRKARYLKA